ncbi:hypothetical protein P7K49_032188 [Saguinus oedipus]|uniref:Uncharacterized protein n=1 Tax=Saguinus oedipus TaxID=9490 RepID=A0ABQ9TXI5_SAGOE|nr:hypothetical protein P7K49_032188 [Saguinus oedipus]
MHSWKYIKVVEEWKTLTLQRHPTPSLKSHLLTPCVATTTETPVGAVATALAGVLAVDMVVALAMAVGMALAVAMAVGMALDMEQAVAMAVDTALAVDMAVAMEPAVAMALAVDTALAGAATDHFATEDAIPLAANHQYESSLPLQ